MIVRLWAVALVVAVSLLHPAVAPCGPDQVAAHRPLRVVSTTSILNDFVRMAGGDRVEASCLVPPLADDHAYTPTPDDVSRVANADIVVVNGLGLDDWAVKVAEGSGFKGPIVVASAKVVPIRPGHAEDDHGHAASDPHAWMDVSNAVRYLEVIRDALIQSDSEGAADYESWCALATAQLRALDAWLKRESAAIPKEQRMLVTEHDAFRYFGAAYGFETRTLKGTSTQSEPDARALAALIADVRASGVRGVFLEQGASGKALQSASAEAGAPIAGQLYVGSVAPPGEPADTYIGMMQINMRTIRRGLE